MVDDKSNGVSDAVLAVSRSLFAILGLDVFTLGVVVGLGVGCWVLLSGVWVSMGTFFVFTL